MSFIFSRRFLTIGALCLLTYVAVKDYSEYKASLPEGYHKKQKYFEKRLRENDPSYKPKYSMKMDSDKGYEEYSLTEKIIYKVFKDDIEEAKQHAPKEFKAQDEISLPLSGEKEPKIGAKIGNKVTYSYKIQGEASSKDIKNLSIVLGQRKAPKHIEFSLIGMAVNEDKTIEMPLKEVRPSYKGEDKALVNIKLLKIE